MTFKLNNKKVSRRRRSSSTSFSVSSGVSKVLWKNTGAGGSLQFTGATNSHVKFRNDEFPIEFGKGPNPSVPEDFTIEWWQFETDTNSAPRPWAFGSYPNTQLGISFEGAPNDRTAYIWGFGGVTFSAFVGDISNTSRHFALVRNSGTLSLFMDGKVVGSTEDNWNYNDINVALFLGGSGSTNDQESFAGLITNFNILTYAKYTGNYTPTQTALSRDTNTILLVPAATQELYVEPYGSYSGIVNAADVSWSPLTPFKFAAPSPFVTFPYQATNLGTITTYQYPETHWSSYGQMASEGSAAGLVAYTYWGWAQGYACAASDFAVFSLLSNDNYVNDFYCPNGGTQTTTTQYACPDGGVSDGNGNCVLLPSVFGGSLGSDSTYYYRAFTSSESLQITNAPLTADILLVAGGGGGGAGGGYEAGGGGGAGGVLYIPNVTINEGSYPVIVGNGGAYNSNGGDSYISPFTPSAIGGGFGGPYGAGNTGGSGGGAPGWGANTQPGSGTLGQGNRGGYGTYEYGSSLPGGGGGAASVGGDAASSSHGGNGGVGTSDFSAWGWATETGHHVNNTTPYFAGGGGGGTNWYGYYSGGSGGYGGGAPGGVNGDSGWSTTGGGGGGSNNNYSSAGSGGSGVVILRYLKSGAA